MIIYSHRGDSTHAPENTMSSFYLAYLSNTDGIECDIRKTKDDVLVICHDKTIERTSNGFGKIKDKTYNELLKYDFGNKKYIGEKIVTLEEFLKYFSKKEIYLFIEIKEKDYEDDIVRLIKKYNSKYITLISFKHDALKKIRELSSDINIGLLISYIDKDIIEKCKKINMNNILLTSVSINEEVLSHLHSNNFLVTAWAILTNKEAKRMEKLGVDAIITDSAYSLKKYLGINNG